MTTHEKSVNTSVSSRNKYLESLLYDYKKYKTQNKISYELFQIMSLAFLKENNETLTTLKVNREFRQELFYFVNDLLSETNLEISSLVKQYNEMVET